MINGDLLPRDLQSLDFSHRNVLQEGKVALLQYISMEKSATLNIFLKSVEPSISNFWGFPSWSLGISMKKNSDT